MTRLMLVAFGGALGSVARYGVGMAAVRLGPGSAWPWATLAVNLIGGLAMGLLVGWLALKAQAGSDAIRLFAAVGLLGGFTTFSAYSLEVMQMIERRQWGLALTYAGLSVILSVAALGLGLYVARRVFA